MIPNEPQQPAPKWVFPDRTPKQPAQSKPGEQGAAPANIGKEILGSNPVTIPSQSSTHITARRESTHSDGSSPKGTISAASSPREDIAPEKMNDLEILKGKIQSIGEELMKLDPIITPEKLEQFDAEVASFNILPDKQKEKVIEKVFKQVADKDKDTVRQLSHQYADYRAKYKEALSKTSDRWQAEMKAQPGVFETKRITWNYFNNVVFDSAHMTALRNAKDRNFPGKLDLFDYLIEQIKDYKYYIPKTGPEIAASQTPAGIEAKKAIDKYNNNPSKDAQFIKENIIPAIFAKIDSSGMPTSEKEAVKRDFIKSLYAKYNLKLDRDVSVYRSTL